MNDTKFTRREVLKTGCVLAAGIAAPTVITSTALGGAAKAAASERITVGHIGVGGRGRDLFGGVRGLADAQSVAVADCYEDRRTAMAAVCGGKAYKDFREMLERDDIDAVVIATADHQHVPIANMAARKKKSAYVEKPLGLSIEQNLSCLTAFAQSGTVFQYGTQQRSMTHCHHGCELVRRGAVGKILKIEVDCPNGASGGITDEAPIPPALDYNMWLGPAPKTPYTVDRCKPPGTYWVYDQSIGYLGGWGAHPLDIMVWGSDADLSGPIVVEGTGVVPAEGLYDTVFNWDMKIMLGEVELIFRPGDERTRFIGEKGWIQVARDGARTIASDPALLKQQLDPAANVLKVSTNHVGNFIEAIKKEDPTIAVANLKDAVRSDIISHLCDIAVRTSEKITWDPIRHELISGSDKARRMLSRPMREPWTL